MSLNGLRRRGALLSTTTLLAFLASLSPARRARAEGEGASAPSQHAPQSQAAASPGSGLAAGGAACRARRTLGDRRAETAASDARVGRGCALSTGAGPRRCLAGSRPAALDRRPGRTRRGVARYSARRSVAGRRRRQDRRLEPGHLPAARRRGKYREWARASPTQLSTGVATFTFRSPSSLRAAARSPRSLSHYSSVGGHGVAGVGWDVGVPFIARQTDRGLPQYHDPRHGGAWTPSRIASFSAAARSSCPCASSSGGACAGALARRGHARWAGGWQYFRPRVEGRFLRFFWSPDHRTWRVQSKSGVSLELGVPLDGTATRSASRPIPSDRRASSAGTSRASTTLRQREPADATPLPTPSISSSIATASTAACRTSPTSTTRRRRPSRRPRRPSYAHHTHLPYERGPTPHLVPARLAGRPGAALAGVDVTSHVRAAPGARELVRRYHLALRPELPRLAPHERAARRPCADVGRRRDHEPSRRTQRAASARPRARRCRR